MLTKKSIWYISKYIAPTYAAKNQARGFLILSSLSQMGHKAVLITSDSSHQIVAPEFQGARMSEVVDGVEVHWLKTWKYKKARSIGRILSWFDFEFQLLKMPKKNLPRPDCIIVSSLSLLTILSGIWLRRKFKCKLVFEVRDIWPLVLTETGGFSPKNPLVMFLQWVEKFGYLKADKIVGTMPNLSEHVRKVTHKDLATACIPQGVDPAFIDQVQPLDQDYVQTYIPKDKFIVCYAGSIGADNALETLFECARLMQDRSDIHFLLLGEGDLKDSYIQANKDLENITFAPRVEKKQVQSVLSLADVVYFSVSVSPIWQYGQSLNKLVDYMLSGKPIIASYTGYPSMINEAGCGVYVPAENVQSLKAEIEKMVGLPLEQRTAMGAKGHDWILANRQFDRLARDYLQVMFGP